MRDAPLSPSSCFLFYLLKQFLFWITDSYWHQTERQTLWLVYVSKYTNSVCMRKWRYETYDFAELKSQYQIYVVHKCKHSYMHGLCNHVAQLRYVKWKVAWPLIQSICPRVKTLNLSPITPCLLRGNMCHGQNRRSLEIRQYYFPSCCHVSINCNLYQNEEGGCDISLSETHATAAGDAV